MAFSLLARRWALVFLLLGVLAGETADTVAAARVFHLDLRSLGAVSLEKTRTGQEAAQPGYPEALAFLDNSTLAVSFPIFNPQTALSTRGSSQGGTRLFHTVVIDLAGGRVSAERSWGTASISDTLLALADGNLMVRSGNNLSVFSRDWKQEHSYQIGDGGKSWLMASPSGRSLFVITRVGRQRERVEVLASQDLSRRYGFFVASMGLDAGSDSHFAYMLPTKDGYALFAVPLEAFAGKTPPSPRPLYVAQEGCNRPFFVADDLLVLTGRCDAVNLTAVEGNTKVLEPLERMSALVHVKTASNQRRFALWVSERVAPVKTEATPDPIAVYDLEPGAKVADLEVEPASAESVPRLDFALSSDGSLLAVLLGYEVSVYKLPPAEPAPSR